MNILAAIQNDPNVSDEFRNVLRGAHAKAAPRRFTAEPITAMGELGGIGRVGSDRWNEVRAEELAAQRDDERFAAIWGDDAGDEE